MCSVSIGFHRSALYERALRCKGSYSVPVYLQNASRVLGSITSPSFLLLADCGLRERDQCIANFWPLTFKKIVHVAEFCPPIIILFC